MRKMWTWWNCLTNKLQISLNTLYIFIILYLVMATQVIFVCGDRNLSHIRIVSEKRVLVKRTQPLLIVHRESLASQAHMPGVAVIGRARVGDGKRVALRDHYSLQLVCVS